MFVLFRGLLKSSMEKTPFVTCACTRVPQIKKNNNKSLKFLMILVSYVCRPTKLRQNDSSFKVCLFKASSNNSINQFWFLLIWFLRLSLGVCSLVLSLFLKNIDNHFLIPTINALYWEISQN